MADAGGEFDQHLAGLLSSAAEASATLRRFGEDRWASWIEQDATRIERGDRYGLDSLLTAFGGMGSLNDLVIHPLNGHRIADDEIDAINQRLGKLIALLWHHAGEMKRGLDGG